MVSGTVLSVVDTPLFWQGNMRMKYENKKAFLFNSAGSYWLNSHHSFGSKFILRADNDSYNT